MVNGGMPISATEEREARRAVATEALQGQRKRVTQAAITTAVALARISAGHYGAVSADQTRVKEASKDLCLKTPQETELRKRVQQDIEEGFRKAPTLERFFSAASPKEDRQLADNVQRDEPAAAPRPAQQEQEQVGTEQKQEQEGAGAAGAAGAAAGSEAPPRHMSEAD